MIRLGLLSCIGALAACGPAPLNDVASRAAPAAQIAQSSLPPMKSFAGTQVRGVARPNDDIARDFLDLSFQLESGRTLPVFTRFEGPIGIRVTGAPPNSLRGDLHRLMNRLRAEAGIDLHMATGRNANITLEFVPRAQIRRALAHAACFVVPNISRLAEYRRAQRSASSDWAELSERNTVGVFLPNDASPQEVRDCLHEELAQALGPLNDLYRLSDSVFNDDNMHTVLTSFDMLILRLTYAPELRSGMSRQEVAARLPSILARINPAGQGLPSRFSRETPRDWISAVETALGPGTEVTVRRSAARRALDLARQNGLSDNRLGFSHYIYARLMTAQDADIAVSHLYEADRIFARGGNMAIHRATVATQLAAYEISRGDGPQALALIEPQIPVAKGHENAALLSTLMLMRAEALALTGRIGESEGQLLDSLGWARYGFGEDWAVRAKMREIRNLNPIGGSGRAS